MKKIWTHSLTGILSVLLLAGCSSEAPASEEISVQDLKTELEGLSREKTTSGVQKVLGNLVSQTSETFDHCYTLHASYTVEGASGSLNGNVSHPVDAQDSVQTYLYSDGTLYEVVRYSATDSSTPYLGIIRINQESTLQLNCIPASEEVSVFQSNPELILDYTLNDANKALDGLKANEVENALLSEEQSTLAGLFSISAPACYHHPEDYDFSLSEGDGDPVLEISLKSPKPVNPDDPSAGTLNAQKIQISLDPETYAMEQVSARAEIENEDTSSSVRTSRVQISPAYSAQEIGFLKDLFSKIENRQLNIKDTFTLEMSGEEPAETE